MTENFRIKMQVYMIWTLLKRTPSKLFFSEFYANLKRRYLLTSMSKCFSMFWGNRKRRLLGSKLSELMWLKTYLPHQGKTCSELALTAKKVRFSGLSSLYFLWKENCFRGLRVFSTKKPCPSTIVAKVSALVDPLRWMIHYWPQISKNLT